MIRRLLTSVARMVKRDSTFDMSDDVPARALVSFIIERGGMLVRGIWLSVRARKGAFPVFVGRSVTVRNPSSLQLEPGVTIGDYCRLDCLGTEGIVLRRGATLRRGAHIEVTSVLRDLGVGCVLEERVGVSEGAYIGAKGPVSIGADTIIGPGVKIVAENHRIEQLDATIREQGVTREGIEIGEDCWLGAGSVIVDGVRVGAHSVVGAGAVVTKDVEPWVIVVGVPARVMRSRRGDDQT